MRKKISGLVAVVFVLGACLGIVSKRALAYPPCGPFDEPLSSTSGSFCRPMYSTNELVQLAPGVPFAWIRSTPSSSAPVLKTIYPTSYPSMKVTYANDQNSAWDGFQNWFQVHPYPLDTNIVGWVEQASIMLASRQGYPPEDPINQAQWAVPQIGYVKPGIPFLWIRTQPASDAAIVYTIPAGGALTITGTPSFDGVQWWWVVYYSSPSGVMQGYVEQQRIIASDGFLQ
jgi:hypothetical protein